MVFRLIISELNDYLTFDSHWQPKKVAISCSWLCVSPSFTIADMVRNSNKSFFFLRGKLKRHHTNVICFNDIWILCIRATIKSRKQKAEFQQKNKKKTDERWWNIFGNYLISDFIFLSLIIEFSKSKPILSFDLCTDKSANKITNTTDCHMEKRVRKKHELKTIDI